LVDELGRGGMGLGSEVGVAENVGHVGLEGVRGVRVFIHFWMEL
jgi:hypothetical protein